LEQNHATENSQSAAISEKVWYRESLSETIVSVAVGPKASSALAVVKRKPISTVSATYISANPAVTKLH
jgi:hypothetical protein